ncbi:hypothetical protein IW262DRAFT_1294948 [Armillaria fumosa]|nr:hypothetical protein IW262DRAFT_1294948 [Armillaria fumosa]
MTKFPYINRPRPMKSHPNLSAWSQLASNTNRKETVEQGMWIDRKGVIVEIPAPSFVNHSLRFTDAYACGLNSKQAAWAAQCYRGHRVLPESVLEELEKENII